MPAFLTTKVTETARVLTAATSDPTRKNSLSRQDCQLGWNLMARKVKSVATVQLLL